MEAKKLLDAAPFAPKIVMVVKREFEEAWASIAPTIEPDRIDDTRLALAHALIAGASAGDLDPETLNVAALEAVKKHPPRVSASDP
jgi:hypothetical protein